MKKFVLFAAVVLLMNACKSKCVDCDVMVSSDEVVSERIDVPDTVLDTTSGVVLRSDSLLVEPELLDERGYRDELDDLIVWGINIAVVMAILLIAMVVWIFISARNYQKVISMLVPWRDLGLPSGRLWKSLNEKDTYTFDEAAEKFGGELPSYDDWVELCKYCRWTWKWLRKGFVITGPNGNFIFLPSGVFYDEKFHKKGLYWSSTVYSDEEFGQVIGFSYKSIDPDTICKKSNKLNVRLCISPSEKK